jgi:WS/DGAT/MGAT family acyltransferase
MSGYERLSVEDRLHLDLEQTNVHTHVAGVLVLEAGPVCREGGGVDIDRIREALESRLFRMPRYRQRLASIPLEDHPVWVDDASFNLNYHVRHARLPLPGDERQLKRLVGRVVSQKLDRGKPLWEMWVVEELEHDRCAVIMKVHHCMADGLASIELMQAILTLEPVKSFEPPPAWLPRPVPEPRELLEGAVRRRLRAPFELGGALLDAVRSPRRTLDQGRQLVESVRAARDAQAASLPDTPLNLPIGPHRRYDWLVLDLDEARRIKRALGGTINDVVLATVAGAVGRFLEQRGVTRREQEDFDFRVACPVSIRDSAEDGRLGNRVSSLIVPLPIAEPDPRRRFEAVNRATQALKASRQELVVRMAQTVSEWTWPGLYGAFARAMLERQTANMVVSDVPGPPVPLYLLGARVLETYPVLPLLPNQALGVACLSYAGGLYWGFNSDWERVPDLHDFVVAVDRAFAELGDAADGGEA